MKTYSLIILAVVLLTYCNCEDYFKYFKDKCHHNNDLQEYQKSIFDFMVPLFKSVASHSQVNFFFSPRSVWMSLYTIAEGSDHEVQKRLYKFLRLPDNLDQRQNFYRIMNTSVTQVYGVNIVDTKKLFLDEHLNMNPSSLNLFAENYFLDVFNSPIQNSHGYISDHLNNKIDLSGKSMFLENFDFNGLWTTAFEDAVVENSPFYNQRGEQIGFVDFMRVKRKARMAYVKSINAKLLEVPLGAHGKYRMLFYMILGRQDTASALKKMTNDIVMEMFHSLKESNVPIDIAIPRFEITTEVDVRIILEGLQNSSDWRVPESKKHIPTPPIFPSTYMQRASFTLNKYGISPPPMEKTPPPGTPTGLAPEVGTDFIANRPLFFGLFEADTYTPLIGAGVSSPTTYKYATTHVRKIRNALN